MQRQHLGRPGTAVIPTSWAAGHRPTLAGTRDATVQLRRPGGTQGDFDPDTGTYPTVPHEPYYTGAARIQVLANQAQQHLVAEQEISLLAYAVYLEHTVSGALRSDLCTVTAVSDNGDPELVGRTLIVEAIERGSLQWQRHLVCIDNLETQDA